MKCADKEGIFYSEKIITVENYNFEVLLSTKKILREITKYHQVMYEQLSYYTQ